MKKLNVALNSINLRNTNSCLENDIQIERNEIFFEPYQTKYLFRCGGVFFRDDKNPQKT